MKTQLSVQMQVMLLQYAQHLPSIHLDKHYLIGISNFNFHKINHCGNPTIRLNHGATIKLDFNPKPKAQLVRALT